MKCHIIFWLQYVLRVGWASDGFVKTLFDPVYGLLSSITSGKFPINIIHTDFLADSSLHPLQLLSATSNLVSFIHVKDLDSLNQIKVDSQELTIVLPLENEYENLLPQLLKKYMCGQLRTRITWLFEDTLYIRDMLGKNSIPFDSRVLLFGTKSFVSEAYHVDIANPLIITKLGQLEDFLFENDKSMLLRRSKHLNGIQLSLGYVEFSPMLYLDHETQQPKGVSMAIWESIGTALNITSNLVHVGSFGKLGANGSWSGVVGMIQRGELDLSVNGMSTTLARSFAIDFLHPVGESDYVLATYIREDLTGGALNVFRLTTYFGIFALIFMSSIVGICILHWGQSWNANSTEVIVLSLGASVTQGMESYHLKGLPTRILFYSQYIFGVMLLAVFSARLTSTLAVKETKSVVHSLEDVSKFGYKLYINGGGNTESVFRNALPGSIHHKLWQDQMSTDPKYFPSDDQSLFAALDKDPDGVCFLPYAKVTQRMGENQRFCRAAVQTIETRIMSMASRKNFWFGKLISFKIDEIREKGVLENLYRKHLNTIASSPEYICSLEESTVTESIGMVNIGNFFYFIIAGVVMSIFVAIVEHLFKSVFRGQL